MNSSSGAPAPLTLYYSPGACSFAAHAALRQAGATFDLARVDVRARENFSDAYRAVNPHERVPALRIGEDVLTELVAIALWVDRAYPNAALFPVDPIARAKAIEWVIYLATTAHPLFRAFWRSAWFAEDAATHPAMQATSESRLRSIYSELDAAIAARRVLNGETLGFADFYAAVYLRWSNAVASVRLTDATLAYRERLLAHPIVAEVLDIEGVSLDTMRRRGEA